MDGHGAMSVAEYFRKLARRCRRLSKTVAEPEVVEQIQVWAVDLADEADRAERSNYEPRADRRNGRRRAAETMRHPSGTRMRLLGRRRE